MLGSRQCFLHPCQKQESINIASFWFEKTISGLPGSVATFVLNRSFSFFSASRRARSISVSLLLTRRIISVRLVWETVSILLRFNYRPTCRRCDSVVFPLRYERVDLRACRELGIKLSANIREKSLRKPSAIMFVKT